MTELNPVSWATGAFILHSLSTFHITLLSTIHKAGRQSRTGVRVLERWGVGLEEEAVGAAGVGTFFIVCVHLNL